MNAKHKQTANSSFAGLQQPAGTDAGQDGTRLLEFSSSAGAPLRVDRERGMIYGVKVLGVESANRRTYLPEALRKAATLYEGVAVNVDHVGSGTMRSYRDRIGKLSNIRFNGDGLYGDLLVNPKHPLAEQLFWDAEHCPSNVGLSHDAKGRTTIRDGKVIVEGIESVRSVDLVAEPATTKSLYESAVDAVLADDDTDAKDDTDTSNDDADKSDDASPNTLPDDAFALVLPGGVKIRDKTFPLHKRYFPIHTADAVKRSFNAAQANRKLAAHHKQLALQRIRDAARKFGIDLGEDRHKESQDMDLSTLTLEQLAESRPDLIEAVIAQTAAKKELETIREERDKLAAELETHKRREAVEAELREAELHAQDIPEGIRATLVHVADTDERKKIIADLKSLIRERSKPVSARPGMQVQENIQDIIQSWRA